MFQPQSTPFATSFYGVAGAGSTSASSSQPSYGLLPLGLSPDGDDNLIVPGYGFAPSSAGHGSGLVSEVVAAGSLNSNGGRRQNQNLNGGSPGSESGSGSTPGQFSSLSLNNRAGLGAGRHPQASSITVSGGGTTSSLLSETSGGKRPLDQTDFKFDGAARLSSKESHHGRATAAQLRQEQQQSHLLYASPSPISLAHRIPRRTQQQQQQQQQELESQHHLLMLGQAAPATTPGHACPGHNSVRSLAHSHSHVPRPSTHTTAAAPGSTHAGGHSQAHAHAHAHAHANANTHAHAHSRPHHPAAAAAAGASPNHQPSPPSHSRSHLTTNLNPPLSHFVQPGSSSCNQQASLNYTHHHKANAVAAAAAAAAAANHHQGFSIPSPAGSASSSSNLNLNIIQAAGDPSSAHPYTSGGHSSSIVTPAASTPSNRAHTADMAGDSASESVFQDDLIAQQRAAETYQPQLEGPVIGERVSSDVITEEYAKADQFYVEKTINLPQTYSHFRSVQGDGNCGWRAIGFSYFEQLILSGDPEKLQLEVARMTSLNNYLSTYGGYDLTLFEDMVYETINLLKDLAACVTDTNAAMTLLMQRFNDRECSNAIVYHLRLLAGSWLKGNFTQYEPFLDTGGDVATWAHHNIEVPDKEIDHLSIMLLSSILLKPIGVVLEIAYLDRTPGSQVNTYRFPDETNGQDPMSLGPIIYLLFRPDHYDILYKSPRESIMPTPQPVALNLQVNRAASFSHHHQITSHPPSLHTFATLDYSPLAMLPGFGGPTSGLTSMTTSSPASPMHNAFASPAQSWMQSPFPDTPMQQNIPPPPQQQQQQQQQPPVLAAGPTQAPSPTQVQLSVAGAPAKPNQNPPVDYQLRFSSQCFHLKNPAADSSLGTFAEPSFTTTMFKNSHFNKAHYNNPHFHPEEWAPEDEAHERIASGVAKKKSKAKPE